MGGRSGSLIRIIVIHKKHLPRFFFDFQLNLVPMLLHSFQHNLDVQKEDV